MEFTVKGSFRAKDGSIRSFSKTVDAKSERHAKELILSTFGAKNGIKRSLISISEVSKK